MALEDPILAPVVFVKLQGLRHNNDGTSNDTTPVTVVAAPPDNTRRVVTLMTFYDPAGTATLTIRFNRDGNIRRLKDVAIAANGTYTWADEIVLDATDEKIEIVMGGAVASEVEFVTSYTDYQ